MTAARGSRSPAGPTTPRWVRAPSRAGASSSTSSRASSVPEAALRLLALAPGVDHEVVGGVTPVADRRHLVDVRAEAVRVALGRLLDRAAGDLRVAVELVGVARPGVQREAGVPQEVERLDALPHRAEPQLAVRHLALDAADARRSVAPERRDREVAMRLEALPGERGELRRRPLELA